MLDKDKYCKARQILYQLEGSVLPNYRVVVDILGSVQKATFKVAYLVTRRSVDWLIFAIIVHSKKQ